MNTDRWIGFAIGWASIAMIVLTIGFLTQGGAR